VRGLKEEKYENRVKELEIWSLKNEVIVQISLKYLRWRARQSAAFATLIEVQKQQVTREHSWEM